MDRAVERRRGNRTGRKCEREKQRVLSVPTEKYRARWMVKQEKERKMDGEGRGKKREMESKLKIPLSCIFVLLHR